VRGIARTGGAWGGAAVGALVDLLWPECCVLCEAPVGGVAWTSRGPQVPGMRRWDRPHLCCVCRQRLSGEPRLRRVDLGAAPPLCVAAGRAESPELVSVVAALKYRGVRGLAWALAEVAAPAAALLPAGDGANPTLVPVPLHGARRRSRGFNQAELLAQLLGARLGWPVIGSVVRRRRATPQQAKIASDLRRRRANVDGAFAAVPAPGPSACAVLVDDLATSGQTLAAAARALQGTGWLVRGAIVAGAGADCGMGVGAEAAIAP
jgi:predicted amidophosphoribosyltransferase